MIEPVPPFARWAGGNAKAMSSTDPFEQANEADVAEQEQDLDGSDAEPQFSRAEAAEADILEQGAEFSDADGDEAAYPHAEEDEG